MSAADMSLPYKCQGTNLSSIDSVKRCSHISMSMRLDVIWIKLLKGLPQRELPWEFKRIQWNNRTLSRKLGVSPTTSEINRPWYLSISSSTTASNVIWSMAILDLSPWQRIQSPWQDSSQHFQPYLPPFWFLNKKCDLKLCPNIFSKN